jgi:Tfp pilus assembly protein PilF
MPPAPREQPAAVVALLDHAEQQANNGDLQAAAMTLERAIRIDSRNPVLWHHLASVRLAEGNAGQAEELAKKSNALAAGNYALQARNWGLIAEARRKRGDTAGAQSADRQKQALLAR